MGSATLKLVRPLYTFMEGLTNIQNIFIASNILNFGLKDIVELICKRNYISYADKN